MYLNTITKYSIWYFKYVIVFLVTNTSQVWLETTNYGVNQNRHWPLPEMELRTQGSRPRPRTQKNLRPRTAFLRTEMLEAKDRSARGQGQRTKDTSTSALQKKGLYKNFSGDLHKKTFSKNFFRRSTKF